MEADPIIRRVSGMPCPFCEHQSKRAVYLSERGGEMMCQVMCERCGTTGPRKKFVTQAYSAWEKTLGRAQWSRPNGK